VTALAACRFADDLALFAVGIAALGMCTAVFYVARAAYLTESVPAELRARALSTLSGSHRIGLFLGPFVGAAAIAGFGFEAAYVVAMTSALVVALVLSLTSDQNLALGATPSIRGVLTVGQLMRANRSLFATLGTAIVALAAVRGVRQTALPLWAEHIGLSPAHISLVLGIANAVDMTLFYPAGKIMDHYGRLSIAVPSAVLLGVGLMLLPLTTSATTLTLAAIVISAGNGIGSGINMTIAADAAPPHDRARFLSIWRLLGDAGAAAGPLVLAGVANAAALAVGIVAVGPLGLVAAVGMLRWVPRYSPYATRAAVRQHRVSAADQ
jgi:MFS family permease